MSIPAIAVALPFLAAIVLGSTGTPLQGAFINFGVCGFVLPVTLFVLLDPGSNFITGMLQADPLSAIFSFLSAFVALTTAISNIDFVRNDIQLLNARGWRFYHALCQIMLGATLLGLYADNIGLLWLAVEIATIAAICGIGLKRHALALAAVWKYSVLGGVGIALALFGSLLIYLSAQPALGPGLPAMSFAALTSHAAQLDGKLLTLACVFLLFGYGTKAALVPLHGWLLDAYSEGPAPLTTMLGGLPMNVALIAILRFQHLLHANADANGGAIQPGPILMAIGLASLLFAAFSLSQPRDSRRFFGVSEMGHSGIVAFAFGIGGPAAIFAGLLHLLIKSLISSALFQALTRAAAMQNRSFGRSHLRGLLVSNKGLAWILGACIFALTGLPPSGLFVSEYLIISETIQRQPLMSLPLALGLAISAFALLRAIGPMLSGSPPSGTVAVQTTSSIGTAGLHLLVALVLAFAMPLALVRMLSGIAGALQ